MAKYMDILLFNPDNGRPVLDVHEYRGVLLEEQTLDCPDVEKYHSDLATRKVPSQELNNMLDNLFRQPAMESSYRRNGIEPNQVENFIARVKTLPEIDRRALIDVFYASYGNAAHSDEGYVKGKLTISGEKEWDKLGEELIKYPNLKALQRKIEATKEANQTIQEPKKEGFGKKIMRWFEKKNIDTKGMKNLVAGIVSAVVLTPAAMKLMQLTAKEDFAKIAKSEQKAQQSPTQDMSKVYDMNKNVRS